ncbi:MAG TPA: phosphate ABC transporter permease PstA [Chloroflexota bacterium]|nr:phosphate ABC transporter permease PstA [Chloroflexota bacterium]
MAGAMILSAIIVLIPLFAVGAYVVQQGWPALIGHFPSILTEQSPAGGQLIEGLKGTLILIGLACVVGLPIGVMSGLYLAEYGRNRFGDVVRFTADVMAGLPSIVAGIVAYSVLVLTTKHFSAYAGGLALGLLMFPTVTRSTEAVVRLVPDALREGGLALGISRWRTIVSIVMPAALSGIITGIILGVARVAGETAPLIFTVLGNNNGFIGLTQPVPALSLQIFQAVASPVDPTQDYPVAYAGVMLLFLLVVVLNLLARLVAARRAVARG